MLGLARLGEFSTAWYRSRIDSEVPGLQYALIDCDFARINRYLPDNFEGLAPLLAQLVAAAEGAGVAQLLLPNITLHHAFWQYPAWQGDIVLFDPFEMLDGLIGLREVFVLGTRHTQSSDILRRRLRERGIDLRMVNDEQVARVDAIRQAIYRDGCSEALREALGALVEKLVAECPVLIACSELSIALGESSEGVVDLASLQIAAFLKAG